MPVRRFSCEGVTGHMASKLLLWRHSVTWLPTPVNDRLNTSTGRGNNLHAEATTRNTVSSRVSLLIFYDNRADVFLLFDLEVLNGRLGGRVQGSLESCEQRKKEKKKNAIINLIEFNDC